MDDASDLHYGAALFEPEIVLDARHAFHRGGHGGRQIDLGLRADKSAQLHARFKRFYMNVSGFKAGLVHNGGNDFGGDHAIIKILASTLLLGGRATAQQGHATERA